MKSWCTKKRYAALYKIWRAVPHALEVDAEGAPFVLKTNVRGLNKALDKLGMQIC